VSAFFLADTFFIFVIFFIFVAMIIVLVAVAFETIFAIVICGARIPSLSSGGTGTKYERGKKW